MMKKWKDPNGLFCYQALALLLLIAGISQGPVGQVAKINSKMPNQHNREAEQAHRVVGMLFTHKGLAGTPIFVLYVQTTTKKFRITTRKHRRSEDKQSVLVGV